MQARRNGKNHVEIFWFSCDVDDQNLSEASSYSLLQLLEPNFGDNALVRDQDQNSW